jgi:hypothetical protein
MTQQMRISRDEKARFDAICRHYGCDDAEVDDIKVAARRDPQAWRDCYGAMWEELFGGLGRPVDPALYAVCGQREERAASR